MPKLSQTTKGKPKTSTKANAFDYVRSLNEDRKNPLIEGTLPASGYEPFLANRAQSLHEDTVMIANEMNVRPQIPKNMQFHFMFELTPKRRRYWRGPWPKPESEDVIEAIVEIYEVSEVKAIEMADVLTKEQKVAIVE